MTSTDFLKRELEAIANKFTNVHIKYGYNDIIETHIVELLPLIEYNTNKALDDAWIPVSLKFMEMFKDEEVAFISSDSSLTLKNVIFEFNASCTEESVISELYAPLTEIHLCYTFPTEFPNGRILANTNFNCLNSPIEILSEESNLEYSYLAAA